MSGESNWALDGPDESSCSGGGSDGPWDDALEEPEPEYGDFWPETDDEEEVAE